MHESKVVQPKPTDAETAYDSIAAQVSSKKRTASSQRTRLTQ